MQLESPKIGGIILCGGKSRRMGHDKASLPVGPETMLSRTAGLLAQVVSPIVVIAAAEQSLPAVEQSLTVAHDRDPEQGPLEGIAVGLMALAGKVEAAYVTAVDVPLLQPSFVQAVIKRLDAQSDIVLPVDDEHHHTLAAVYRLSILSELETLLASGERRPRALFNAVRTQQIDIEQLRQADPELLSLINCNRPSEYRAALSRLGFEAEP